MKIKPKTCAWHECKKEFVPRYRSTERHCSIECFYKHQNSKPQKQRSKSKIKPISDKRAEQLKVYSEKRKEFLKKVENKFCAVFPHLLATEVHHKKGKIGELLNDTRYWLAVSRVGHIKIEEQPKWAYEKGFSLLRNSKE